MDTVEEFERFVKSLPAEQRKQYKEKLIERVMQLQTSQPWDESKSDYNELEDMSFQNLCGLLQEFVDQEELDRPLPWPPEAQQQNARKFKGFRLFLTPRAYEVLHNSPSSADQMVYNEGIKIILGKYPDVFLKDPSFTGSGYSAPGSIISLDVEWSKPITSPDWEGFVLVFHKGTPGLLNNDPHLRFFHPNKPDMIELLGKHCLEVTAS
jgi:hypothetical protein